MKTAGAVVLLILIMSVFSIQLSTAASPIQEKINSFTNEDFYKNQATILEILAYGKEALPYLIQALDNENANIRRYSAQAIGDLGIKDEGVFTTALRRLPIEPNADAKANLIYILDVFNDRRAVSVLAKVLENLNEREDLRYRAGYAMARFAVKESYDVLKNFINDQLIYVRKTALWGLGLSKVPEAEDTLNLVFGNKSEPIIIRYWAARGLIDLGKKVDLKVFRQEFDQKLVFKRGGSDYTLNTDISNETIVDIEKTIHLLDNFHKTFFNADKRIKQAHTVVMLFKVESDFRDFAEIYYPSFYYSGGGYIPSDNLLITYARPDYERTLRLIKHEWTHRFIDMYLYPSYWKGNLTKFFEGFPVWFDEGFAEYVSYTDLKSNQVLVSPDYVADLVRKVDSGTLRKVSDLVKDRDPYRFGFSYSEAWGLVYFLLTRSNDQSFVTGQYPPEVIYSSNQYLQASQDLIQAIKNNSTSINEAFLKNLNSERFQTEWQDFIKKNWGKVDDDTLKWVGYPC